MKRLLLLALLLCVPGPASATIRALFVGIDTYRFSRTHVEDNDFDDLQGAVNDVVRIKQALGSAYALDLDTPAAGVCRSHNAVSITLTNDCATRDAMLGALAAQIAASASGDTILFYFAGHGAQTDDGTNHDQPSGQNDTILPVDARNPDATMQTDILDHDLRIIINGATARGVNFISIFDSCHSGTASRGPGGVGRKRSAPPLRVDHYLPDILPVGPGYWVHLGASTDAEEADEIDVGGGRHDGLFTDALVKTLAQPSVAQATFGDIAAATQLLVLESGHVDQHPQIEGALNATLGGRDAHVPLGSVTVAGTAATMGVGSLSGVTMGSAYALFATRAAALAARRVPLAVGRVSQVDLYAATLALDRTVKPRAYTVREQDHAYGDRQVRLGFSVPTPDLQAFVADILKDTPYAKLADPPQVVMTRLGGNWLATIILQGADGSPIATLPSAADPAFADALRDALRQVAHVQAMLALRTDPTRTDLTLCVDNGMAGSGCVPITGSHGRILEAGKPIRVMATNNTDRPRHLYLFAIDDQYAVQLIEPTRGATDEAIRPHQMLPQDQLILPRSAIDYQFLAIASDQPIDAAALEQDGAGTRDAGRCSTALARLLCDAGAGTRDTSVPSVGPWSAIVASAHVIHSGSQP